MAVSTGDKESSGGREVLVVMGGRALDRAIVPHPAPRWISLFVLPPSVRSAFTSFLSLLFLRRLANDLHGEVWSKNSSPSASSLSASTASAVAPFMAP